MTTWLDKLVKVLALGLDTRIEPEQRAAMEVAADLAAKHQLSLGRAYLRIERNMPDTFKYLEAKRAAAGLASFIADGDAEKRPDSWDAELDHYPGNRQALEAMLCCTVRPLSRRSRAR